jgi:hypothetical protein
MTIVFLLATMLAHDNSTMSDQCDQNGQGQSQNPICIEDEEHDQPRFHHHATPQQPLVMGIPASIGGMQPAQQVSMPHFQGFYHQRFQYGMPLPGGLHNTQLAQQMSIHQQQFHDGMQHPGVLSATPQFN